MSDSRRRQIAMSDTEVTDFLEAQNWMVIGTQGPDGWPHLVTVGYCFVRGNLSFTSYAKAQKIVNLRRNPQITCLIESVGESYADIKGVQVRGVATIIDSPEGVFEVQEAAGRRVGSWDVNLPRPLEELVTKRVAVEIKTTRLISWDHRYLDGRY